MLFIIIVININYNLAYISYMMGKKYFNFYASALFLTASVLFVTAASGLVVYSGETVELKGGASGADYVYLFMTGPNLASGGVSPEDITSAVVTGDSSSFTRVAVSNNRWNYKWDTGAAGGTLDYGNYIMYAANTPSGRHDLSGTEYSYTQITVANPSVSAAISTAGAVYSPAETVANDSIEDTDEASVNMSDSADDLQPKHKETPAFAADSTPERQSGISFGILISAVLTAFVLALGLKSRTKV